MINLFLNWKKNWYKDNAKDKEKSNENEKILYEFIQWISITYENKESFQSRNNVILSSIHQTKGLEFKVVFFIYLDKGIIPSFREADISEEKRLFYVGITRAKEFLFLISSEKKKRTPFLDEIKLGL